MTPRTQNGPPRALTFATGLRTPTDHRDWNAMATVTGGAPAGTPDTPELARARRAARHVAPTLIAEGITGQDIRDLGASRPESGTMWNAVADAMDEITAARAVPAQAAAPDREAVPA